MVLACPGVGCGLRFRIIRSFGTTRPHIEPDGFYPRSLFLLDHVEINCLPDDVDPELTVGKVHQERQENVQGLVLPIVRKGEKDFKKKKEQRDKPDCRVGSRQADIYDVEDAEKEYRVRAHNGNEEGIIQRKNIKDSPRPGSYS